MNYTENYHLPQWVETDRVQMEDFNQMCADIDQGIKGAKDTAETALASLPYVVGTYTGDGTTESRTVTLGFKPSFLVIGGVSRSSKSDADALTRFAIVGPSGTTNTQASPVDTGFVVKNGGFEFPQLNQNGVIYSYIAFK